MFRLGISGKLCFFAKRREKCDMTQLIVNVEDIGLLAELKRAIMMLKGVLA